FHESWLLTLALHLREQVLMGRQFFCYRRLGCFSDNPPWAAIPGRFLAGLPDSPESMNISFTLYTKETRNNSQVISAIHSSTIKDSYFCSHRKTRFIVHGYMSTGKRGWVVEMCLPGIEP
uniref:Triacylglycerol lipase n=1 Tax=Terrapene triunguis TaxID=2587831 RepID=A0A674JX87_9SAUR